jgi:hypothetical protein
MDQRMQWRWDSGKTSQRPTKNGRPKYGAGWNSPRVAMMISAHKTGAVFERYNIVSDQDWKQAAKRNGEFLAEKSGEMVTRLVTLGKQNA